MSTPSATKKYGPGLSWTVASQPSSSAEAATIRRRPESAKNLRRSSIVSGRSRSIQCTPPLSTGSNLVFSPAPLSLTVPAGCSVRKSLIQASKIAVRGTVMKPPQPRLYLAASKSTDATISAAFGSRSRARFLRLSRARAASGMNSVCWTGPRPVFAVGTAGWVSPDRAGGSGGRAPPVEDLSAMPIITPEPYARPAFGWTARPQDRYSANDQPKRIGSYRRSHGGAGARLCRDSVAQAASSPPAQVAESREEEQRPVSRLDGVGQAVDLGHAEHRGGIGWG